MTENNEHLETAINERIGFGLRLGAYLLDLLVIIIFGWILGSIVGPQLVDLFFSDSVEQFDELADQFAELDFDFIGMANKVLMISSGTAIITFVMFIIEGVLGQSIGKMLLKIVNTNMDGSNAVSGKLWLRSFLKYGSTLFSLIGGMLGLSFLGTIGSLWGIVIFIGFFFALSENKQTIHDMIAKTVVSKK